MNLGGCAKLAPRYYGPFQVLGRKGLVEYRLALLANTKDNDVFHVSLPKIYVHDPNHVIDWDVIQLELKREFQT